MCVPAMSIPDELYRARKSAVFDMVNADEHLGPLRLLDDGSAPNDVRKLIARRIERAEARAAELVGERAHFLLRASLSPAERQALVPFLQARREEEADRLDNLRLREHVARTLEPRRAEEAAAEGATKTEAGKAEASSTCERIFLGTVFACLLALTAAAFTLGLNTKPGVAALGGMILAAAIMIPTPAKLRPAMATSIHFRTIVSASLGQPR
jgi:hypothetical protein